ncbi:exopolysaccharide biosynthesis polyprenyl glycosylphosphotransferase [Flavobacteriaceae bacterium]|nr:exopolysaccharide biosynthesis polyprenyl glycosylphosphotransferase [Flavobacteriaceae bacterium]
MKKRIGRYSIYLRPISIIIDLVIINTMFFYSDVLLQVNISTLLILSFTWLTVAYFSKFYEVYRYTSELRVFSLIINQSLIFLTIIFGIIGLLNLSITSFSLLRFTFFSIAFILAFKFFVFYSLRIFRTAYGANYRKTIIIGSNSSTLELENFFKSKKELGYFLSKTFDTKKNFSLASVFKYISQKNIDEIYCSVDELNNNSIREIIDYCDNNFKTLKFLPKRENLYYKKLDFHNYGLSTVQAFRKTPIERGTIYYFAKRIFDICFSLAVIILLLSWLIPLISILIKLDSKGPVFFSQIRNGYKYREFKCIKFRSMVVNSKADILTATKGDVRVTRIGKFLRKTSLDEMPQFINVLFGDMSVVGPRPHMIKENTKYAKSIDRFMLRHTVKPGITGLAQINGYRGEIEEVEDIINRIKYDIYYLENWSVILDIKIIINTTITFLKGGEDKAY